MDEFEKQLIFIYTTIAFVLTLLPFVIPFHKGVRKLFFVVLVFSPLIYFGYFGIFVNGYTFAEYVAGDDFGMVQIITNILNFILLYNFISGIRKNK